MSDFDSQEFQEVMILELTERIEELNKGLLFLGQNSTNKKAYDDLMRTLHNLKGLFGLSGYQHLSSLTHSMENILDNLENSEINKVINVLSNFTDELSRFHQVIESGKTHDFLKFDNLTQQQDLIKRMRVVPLETILNRFPRMVRDIALTEGKQIDFIMTGNHIGVDRAIIKQLIDPLTHLLRNAISHGIELPNDRIKLNKNPVGLINLSISYKKSDIVIEIKDNGRGLIYEAIQKKLIKLKTITPNTELTPEQIHNYLLTVGFSTAEETTEVSGRGIGLTAVKQTMDRIGGNIEISSEKGMGTSFRLIIPLSVALT